MKPNSTLTGVLVALIVGLLVLGTTSPNNTVSQGTVGLIIMIPVAYLGIRLRVQTNKNESMAQRGLDHYRYHHHRRVIKKTS